MPTHKVWLGAAALLALSAVLYGCNDDVPGWPSQCAVAVGDSPARGPADAWVTVVEFADFQCPYCADANATIARIDAERPDQVRWVYKHVPMSYHSRALAAAVASECAYQQGRFWEMHALLFAHQTALEDADLEAYATQIGLDVAAWQACLSSEAPTARIAADVKLADDVGVSATPTFFVNGAALVGAAPYADFVNAVDRAREEALATGTAATDYYASLEAKGCEN